MDLLRDVGERLRHLSLASQFAIASGGVLVLASLIVGSYLVGKIEDSVVRNTAIATALYMESFVSPISQQLAEGDQLSENGRRALDEIFTNTPLGERVVSYKIWKEDGRIVEASNKDLVGRTFKPTQGLRRAWSGEVDAAFEELGDEEDAGESALGLPLLEIYSPIREVWSGDIIAVAEFYEVNTQLKKDLVAARRSAWTMTAAVVAGIGGALYLIVLGGSRTIERQRRDLATQFRDLQALSSRNSGLRRLIQQAAARAATSAERSLRRISADLHDGPAQYLAFAALRLDDLRDAQTSAAARDELESIQQAVGQAITEVRDISKGLGLPDIAGLGPCEIVGMAADAHQVRSGEEVALRCTCDAPPDLGPAQRICIYRFVQEELNNASRHAGGHDLEVTLQCAEDVLALSVRDGGPGFGCGETGAFFGLGLGGLCDRVEALGGTFAARDRPGGGAEIVMRIEAGG